MPLLENHRYELYCQHYVATGKKRASAVQAGFSERSASVMAARLSKRPDVQQRIQELKERVAGHVVAESGLSKEWVLAELKFVVVTNRGKATSVRPLELIGKELGMFQDTIPREIFTLMMSLMGASVAQHVQDASALERIMADWERINSAEVKQLRTGAVAVEAHTIDPTNAPVA